MLPHADAGGSGFWSWFPERDVVVLDAQACRSLELSIVPGEAHAAAVLWQLLGVDGVSHADLLHSLEVGLVVGLGDGLRVRLRGSVVQLGGMGQVHLVVGDASRERDPPYPFPSHGMVQRLELLRQISEATVRLPTLEAIIQVALEGLLHLFPQCRLLHSRVDADGLMHVLRDLHRPGLPDITGAQIDLRCAPLYVENLRGPGWLVCDDVRTSLALHPLAPMLLQVGVGAVVDAVFLREEDGSVHLLCVDAPAMRFWPRGELETVRAVAAQLQVADLQLRALHAQRTAEAALHRVRRLDSLGRLAGGIAHDFGNMLQTVLANVDIVRDALDVQDGALAQEALADIREASLRTAALAKLLLGFARTGQSAPTTTLDLRALVQGMVRMLSRLLPADRGLTLHDMPPLVVLGVGEQLEQVLLNLVLNAGAATAPGGQITVTLRAAIPSMEQQVRLLLPAIPHAILTVEDDGEGIAPENLERIFEPFFTTRPAGQGTGLGMSVVWLLVQSHRGNILVDSILGQGTRMQVWLPLAEAPPHPRTEVEESAQSPRD